MALNLYRGHSSHCEGGRKPHEMTYESDKTRRSWKKCACPIYACCLAAVAAGAATAGKKA